MSAIWAACRDQAPLGPLHGHLYRMVESQEQVATYRIVSSLEEQALLEELLETSKPPPPETAGDFHYLLTTPFRYPPLRHGSRFGRRHEPGLFYGSATVDTMLAEVAYYRFVFWQGMETPPQTPIVTQHTVFSARYACGRGLKLQDPPFDAWRATLTDPRHYAPTQDLGSAMREAGVQAFEYLSARDPAAGINVALFEPAALASQRPIECQNWLAETSGEHVAFLGEARQIRSFELETFLVEGMLPAPAVC